MRATPAGISGCRGRRRRKSAGCPQCPGGSRLASLSQLRGHIMSVIFRGISPHDLGPVEQVSAKATGSNVEMTVYIWDEWNPTNLVATRFQLEPAMARLLAEDLKAAVAAAELK